MLSGMATRETRRQRGRRRGLIVARSLVEQLADARRAAGVSQATLGKALERSQSAVCRFEGGRSLEYLSVVEVAEIAAMLGLDFSASLHPTGDPIRDKGHQALLARLRAELSPSWRVAAEVPLPVPGSIRAWDLLLRLADHLVGVEAETRIRDVPALARHVHLRERDGGADEIVVVLARSMTNRALVGQLRVSLGARYAGSGVILL